MSMVVSRPCECERERGKKLPQSHFSLLARLSLATDRTWSWQLHRTHALLGTAPMRMDSHYWLVPHAAISSLDKL